MDVIFCDRNRIEQGVLSDFSINHDATDLMDFELKMPLRKDKNLGEFYWYIPDTEYGGISDGMGVETDSGELSFKGRNWRGILASRIIQPEPRQDYKIVTGNVEAIVQRLLTENGLDGLFSAGRSEKSVGAFKFNRYMDLYSGLIKLAYECGQVLSFTTCTGKNTGNECRLETVKVSFIDRIDYSSDVEYTGHDINFRIYKGIHTVNHLICLGQGELKDRMVAHLYVDGDGDIVENQYYFGLDEWVEVYENTSAATLEELKQGGANRLGELLNIDTVEVTAPDIKLKIGDVVGGREEITGVSVRREIVNIIADIDDDGISFDYKVGGDDPGAASLPSEIVEEYILPIASETVLGGIKLGFTLNNDNEGTLYSEALATFKAILASAERICA